MEDQDQHQPVPDGERSSWSFTRIAGLLLIIVASLIVLYLTVGFIAWQSGENIRSEREETLQSEQISRQVTLAQDDISQGSYNLALRRLAWVLEHDPNNEDALALRHQAEAALKTALTPDAPATPAPSPEPSPTSGANGDQAQELQRMQRLERQNNWQELLDSTLAFQRQYPDYERLKTDGLLYNAYLNQGLAQVQGDQIEIGIYHLAQAENLGDLSQEALDYWLWAELYLQGIAYYGVNWGAAASFFRDLCLAAPFYQGACDKLYDSLVAQGDQFSNALEWCPAIEYYREARQYGRNQALDDKLSQAIQGCAEATPTPAPITGTLPVTGTESIDPPTTGE
jgi:hypothetical protein